MTEVADQLVLEYLGRVADAAHGQLNSAERVDFCDRLRKRIDEHRAGSTDPRQIRQILRRFGDPAFLVARERRRLEESRATPIAEDVQAIMKPVDRESEDSIPAPRRARAPMRTIRRGGRTTRHVTWSPSGVAKLRRELRGQEREEERQRPGRLVGALRAGWQAVTRRGGLTRRGRTS